MAALKLLDTDGAGIEFFPGAFGPRRQLVIIHNTILRKKYQRFCSFLQIENCGPTLIALAFSGLHFRLNINEQIDLFTSGGKDGFCRRLPTGARQTFPQRRLSVFVSQSKGTGKAELSGSAKLQRLPAPFDLIALGPHARQKFFKIHAAGERRVNKMTQLFLEALAVHNRAHLAT